MGFKLGRFLQKQVKSVIKRAPGIVTGIATGNPLAVATTLLSKPATGISPTQAFLPSEPISFPVVPVAQTNGGIAVPAAGTMPAVVGGLSRAVIGAIVRLGGALGVAVTAANISRVGMRLWRSVVALARRHPQISILAFLTGLGLAVEEASEFLFWGQTRQRRRRGRGISARDIRIARRTIRKISTFQRQLGGLARRRSFPRGRGAGGGGIVVAQQD